MLCDFCVQTPEITAFYHMVGNFNVLLRFAVPDVKTLDALVGESRPSEIQEPQSNCRPCLKKPMRSVTQ